MDRSKGKFQVFWELMRSETARLGGHERRGAGVRMKEGSVGTQGVSQIDKGECLWIL
jgi:hypothetical protein